MSMVKEQLEKIGSIIFFHEDGYATNVRGLKEFKEIEAYCDKLESRNMWVQLYNDELYEMFTKCNVALNIACEALAEARADVRKGDTLLCSTRKSDYYDFLMGRNADE